MNDEYETFIEGLAEWLDEREARFDADHHMLLAGEAEERAAHAGAKS